MVKNNGNYTNNNNHHPHQNEIENYKLVIENLSQNEKELQSAKQTLKELNRKLEFEIDSKHKAENKVNELWNKIEHEQNLRSQFNHSVQHSNERINSLEKQLGQASDKIKLESELNVKLKKTNAELNLNITNKEKQLKDINEKINNLQAQNTKLQNELATLQSQVDKSHGLWLQANERIQELQKEKQQLQEEFKLVTSSSITNTANTAIDEIESGSSNDNLLNLKLEKLNNELKQEKENVKQLKSQLESSQMEYSNEEINKLKQNEQKLIEELNESIEKRRIVEEELNKLTMSRSVDELQMKEVQDQFEAEQYFSSLYKTQVKELKEELEEKDRLYNELMEEKNKTYEQYEISCSKADSESLSNKILEQKIQDLEKEKENLEIEIQNIESKLIAKETEMMKSINDREIEFNKEIEELRREKDDLKSKLVQTSDQDKIDQLSKQLKQEKVLTEQAVNKLAEIMNRKDINLGKKKNKNSSTSGDLKKKEKECRKLQQELTTEREKYNQMLSKFQKDINELQSILADESQTRIKLKMEVDSKDAELEQLRQHFTMQESISNSEISLLNIDNCEDVENMRLEGWLSIPHKQNIRKYGWRKQYVVVSSRKIIFYDNEVDKAKADPSLILDLSKLFHVRSVTQGDVIRADTKEIPRIFQVNFKIVVYIVLYSFFYFKIYSSCMQAKVRVESRPQILLIIRLFR